MSTFDGIIQEFPYIQSQQDIIFRMPPSSSLTDIQLIISAKVPTDHPHLRASSAMSIVTTSKDWSLFGLPSFTARQQLERYHF
ncbi:hypothetical protein EYZ11_002013 [Aspergillus tanneri]|uniref:Uncharacterized protein n=1 Tax=Aspergillus tanneri TaxID=1220188 RepID=A0A4S3JS91_9EURO|nr:hypothetical protein EYZ11_002013 [Aspergillus tanneri]